MCGLSVIISQTPTADFGRLMQRMLETIAHRGPDDRGIELFNGTQRAAIDAPATVALGLNRLAIQDLSAAGHQPMADSTGRWWIVFNGEIYNYIELRDELRAQGETFHTGADTEVLLRLIAREGAACLPRLDGMFAFVAYDAQQQRLLAARDRFGIKPCYIYQPSPDQLLLASEIKAFTVHPQWRARLNRARAVDFLRRGIIDHTSETLFADVHQLAAGCMLEIDCTQQLLAPSVSRWYNLAPLSDAKTSSGAAALREHLALAVRRRLRADVPVGSCLSGGLDSSSIVSLVGEARRAADAQQVQKTFTARSTDASIDEWPFAAQVAESAHAEAVEVWPQADELLQRLDELAWMQDEPFGSPSIFAQYCVFRAAREHGITVMLDGQGADEQLAGYHSFIKVLHAELLCRLRLSALMQSLRATRDVLGYPVRIQIAQMLGAALSPRLRGTLMRIIGHRGAADRIIKTDEVGPRFASSGRRGAASYRNRFLTGAARQEESGWRRDPFDTCIRQNAGLRAFAIDLLLRGSLPMLLHWEDRNSMAHGIEARVPFLSHALVEHVLGLPNDQKLHRGWTKVALREAVRNLVPESVRTRTDKIAFATPEAQWMCNEARQQVEALLPDAAASLGNLLQPHALEALRDHLTSVERYDNIVWRVLCLGVWMKRFEVV